MISDLRESGSLEQDADMVMLLHREDAYDREARPGEADFIVAKHRNGPTKTITVAFQGHSLTFCGHGARVVVARPASSRRALETRRTLCRYEPRTHAGVRVSTYSAANATYRRHGRRMTSWAG